MRIICWLLLAGWLGLETLCKAGAQAPDPGPWFALLGDPQIGYGWDGRSADAARFQRLLATVQERGAAFAVIPGDLVQDRTYFQWRDFAAAMETATLPVFLTPGNHDVVDLDSLQDFRDRVGRDHYAASQGGVTLIVVNSETARDRELDPREHDKQWAWLERTLQAHAQDAAPRLLVTHRPPFVEHPDEPTFGGNWPSETRTRLLTLLARTGVRHVLAGHLHETREITDPASGVTIYTVGGSARVKDQHGAGYRAFRVRGGAVQQRYVQTGPASERPPDFLGVRDWTPRVFHFSLRHWLLTLGYAAGGIMALRAAGGWRVRGERWPASTGFWLWAVIGAALLFFAVNEQLDLDEALVGLARAAARRGGWFDVRHGVGAVAAGLSVALGALLMVAIVVRARAARRPAWLALLALAAPSAWFVLSALSDHDLGMVLGATTWDVLLFASAALSIFAARRSLLHATRPG